MVWAQRRAGPTVLRPAQPKHRAASAAHPTAASREPTPPVIASALISTQIWTGKTQYIVEPKHPYFFTSKH